MNTEEQPKHGLAEKSLEASAHATLSLWARVKRVWFRWADLNQHAAWFPFLVGAIVAFDAMVVVLPGDVIVVLAVLSNPKAWRKTMAFASVGGALGAFVLFLLVRDTGGVFLDKLQSFNSELGAPTHWSQARHFFRQYGVWSLAFGSVIPLLSWPPVILAGLAKSPALPVLFCLLIGRFARYLIVCYGIRYGWAFFQTVKAQAHEERAKALGDSPDPDNFSQ
jgi:membrane protein YqaA with SNARE-associated domain